jgi:hypothetical protein
MLVKVVNASAPTHSVCAKSTQSPLPTSHTEWDPDLDSAFVPQHFKFLPHPAQTSSAQKPITTSAIRYPMSKEQLFQLLPLPDDGLQQVLEYATTLSKAEAADHFTNMLGDSPQVIEFISTFNARRADPRPAPRPAPATAPATAPSSGQNSEMDTAPKHRPRQKKKKAPLHTPPPRQVASFELAAGTVYNKKGQEEEYMSGRSGTSTPSNNNAHRNNLAPAKSATPPPQRSTKPSSSGTGTLVSDLGLPKPKPKSNPVSRTSTPGPSSSRNTTTTKISITGGVPMHGTSTALTDLEQAIRSL